MKRHLLCIGSCLMVFLVLMPLVAARAQADVAASASQCRSEVERELSREQRLYRSVLFGHKKAEVVSPGEVRFDLEGNAWIKADDDAWRSVAKGFEDQTWHDTEMNAHDELRERRGIFETRGVLTSDLVPYLTQAYRALQCRTSLVCRTVETSMAIAEKESQNTTVIVPGCITVERRTIAPCQLLGSEGVKTDEGDVLTYCRNVSTELLDRENDLLKLSVEYDAAERSFLQLSGIFDAFLQEFKWPITNTLRKTASLVGSLRRIPCFIGSCDADPRPFATP